MPYPPITPLPTPPSRSQSPATFSADADAFLGALPDFQADANALGGYLDGVATAAEASATDAAAEAAAASISANIAAGAANYQGDYSALVTYQIGESVSYNSRRYVAKTVNLGVTPSDGANWFLINDGDVLGPASATGSALAVFDGGTGKLLKSGAAPGTSGNVLVSNGTEWVSQAPPSAGSLLRLVIFTTSGTWTKGAGTNFIRVRGVGGGGGGQVGQGGGAGGYFEKFMSTGGITSVAVTIGSGGAGSTSSGGTAPSGGNTSFGAYAIGYGGTGGTWSDNDYALGGSATGGDINITGGAGGTQYTGRGAGGASILGAGGAAHYSNASGQDAPGYGGGGGGVNSGYTPANGRAGIVIVEEYA